MIWILNVADNFYLSVSDVTGGECARVDYTVLGMAIRSFKPSSMGTFTSVVTEVVPVDGRAPTTTTTVLVLFTI